MDLEQLGKRDGRLQGLLRQVQHWRRLDGKVKQVLPANLREHFQTACIQEGVLILLAANNMAASRLKMILPPLLPQLQGLEGGIERVQVKVAPRQEQPQKSNSLSFSPAALANFQAGAEALRHRHPELAQALSELVRRHKAQKR